MSNLKDLQRHAGLAVALDRLIVEMSRLPVEYELRERAIELIRLGTTDEEMLKTLAASPLFFPRVEELLNEVYGAVLSERLQVVKVSAKSTYSYPLDAD